MINMARKKSVKKSKIKGRSPSNKSKENKVKKLIKLAKSKKKKHKPSRKTRRKSHLRRAHKKI